MADGWQAIAAKAKPLLPVALKRRLRQAVPAQYRRRLDPEWHRRAVRGSLEHWDYLGRLQLDYLVEHGLEPHHHVLDVGCGPLRAGVQFIGFLEPGHYAGVEKQADLLERAREVELPRYGLEGKEPLLLANGQFEFGLLDRTFDYAIAQSVFTHLPLNSISRCLVEMGRVLRPGGKFYATIYENPHGKLHLADIRQSETAVTHYDADRYHYDLDTLRFACEGTGLSLGYEGDWGHPENQKMVVFTREGADG